MQPPPPASQRYNNTPSEPQVIRTQVMCSRLRLNSSVHGVSSGSGSYNNENVRINPNLQTSVLLAHANGQGQPGEERYPIGFAFARTSKGAAKIDLSMGIVTRHISGSVQMEDVQAMMMDNANDIITSKLPKALLSSEVETRWYDNRIFERDTRSLDVMNFYAFHATPESFPLYLEKPPTIFKSSASAYTSGKGKMSTKKRMMCFTLLIDDLGYNERVFGDKDGPLAGNQSSLDSAPRARGSKHPRDASPSASQSRVLASTSAKRTRLAGALVSKFPSNSVAPYTMLRPLQITEVTFRKLVVVVEEDNNYANRLEDRKVLIRGHLHDTPFNNEGTMKRPFNFWTEDGLDLIAKRFFRVDDEGTAVTPHKQRQSLQQEGIRLVLGQNFLTHFMNDAKADDIEIERNITFAEAFLGEEVLGEAGPSPASGADREDFCNNDGPYWLVEQKRAQSVIRFSGTLSHPSHTDKTGLTIVAFAHYAYCYSQKNIVFADIQGTRAFHHGTASQKLVLFDVMTHTLDGNSGIGDHGEKGIQSFLRDHNCNDVCKAMGFMELDPDNFEPEQEDTDESDPGQTDK